MLVNITVAFQEYQEIIRSVLKTYKQNMKTLMLDDSVRDKVYTKI